MCDQITPETFERLQKGDPKAFESVFLYYHNKITTFIRAIIKSKTDAEDLTQDIFIKIWNNRTTIDTQRSFHTYMYTIARNAAINYLKHKAINATYLTNLPYTDIDICPEALLFAKEIKLLVEMTVSQMPDRRKEIYMLSRNEGFTNDEIATRLNISKKTVENQLTLALQSIRKVISAFLIFFV